MRIALAYADGKAERELLKGAERRDIISQLKQAMSADQLMELQQAVPTMQVSEALLDYVQQIINHTRHSPRFTQGLSPRAGVAILRAAQAWAMMQGRRQVLPEDVQAILPPVVGHRLHGNADAVKGAFEPAHFGITVETPSQTRFAIGVRRRGEEPVYSDIVPHETAPVALPLATPRRGLVRCGRLEVYTRYPVGLFHAWSYVEFNLSVIVYPKPDPFAGTPPAQSRSASEEGIPIGGDEEHNRRRSHRGGDAPKLIAWKALAREEGLLRREFSATASSELWLDWEEAHARDIESRLSVLAHWVLQADRYGQSYGLRIPGTVIPPGRGDMHRARCLEALALFQDPHAA